MKGGMHLLLTATIFLCAGCVKVEPFSEAKAAITIYCVADCSKSAISNHKRYENSFQCLVDAAQPGTRIVVNFITENPLSDSSYPINVFIPPFDPVYDNKLVVEAKQKRAREEAKQKFSELILSTQRGNTSPIIDSLKTAERVFNHYTGSQMKLVIFSDMLEDSSKANFEKKIPRPEEILGSLKSQNALLKLNGVQVVVVGAYAKTSQQYHEVEQFWSKFFHNLGANVTEYGAGLIDCPTLEKEI
jgi:hypothetical protein